MSRPISPTALAEVATKARATLRQGLFAGPNFAGAPSAAMHTRAPHIVTLEELKKRIADNDASYRLIDVRRPEEVADGMIPTAKHVQVSELSSALQSSDSSFASQYGFPKPGKSEEVIFYCLSGGRSSKAVEIAESHGYTNVKNYLGSWREWSKNN